MTSREESEGDGRQRGAGLLLAISAWLYGVLLMLYPKAFLRRYAREMRRDFQELSREGLEEGGGVELARVWTSTLSDLWARSSRTVVTWSPSHRTTTSGSARIRA